MPEEEKRTPEAFQEHSSQPPWQKHGPFACLKSGYHNPGIDRVCSRQGVPADLRCLLGGMI